MEEGLCPIPLFFVLTTFERHHNINILSFDETPHCVGTIGSWFGYANCLVKDKNPCNLLLTILQNLILSYTSIFSCLYFTYTSFVMRSFTNNDSEVDFWRDMKLISAYLPRPVTFFCCFATNDTKISLLLISCSTWHIQIHYWAGWQGNPSCETINIVCTALYRKKYK